MCRKEKRTGGHKRAVIARKSLENIFSSINHPLYTMNDTIIAKHFNISRLTIYNIRKEMNIPCRYQRVLYKLSLIPSENYTIKELASLLNISYKNLCKIRKKKNIKIKKDTPPIVSLLKYNKERYQK